MREWKIKQGFESTRFSDTATAKLRSETGLSLITLKVCIQRGLEDADSIRHFLSPRLESLADPFSIQDMSLAVERIARARAEKSHLWIYGDYDVDGTTGAALLSWFFRDLGLSFEAHQPDRFKDGYGLNVGAVEAAHAQGAQVLVTVDCGITSFDAALRAHELGMDLIVLDHHQVDPIRGIPLAFAVVNPQRADCQSGLKQLCGCGIAFYFLRALRTRGRQEGWWPLGQEPNLKQHLDLVVMATAADMVPLTGDNHILVRHGLQILKQSQKPGVAALLEAAGLAARELSPGHLGFTLGPRINASGRMGSASLALELLTTQDPERAQFLAVELEQINRERTEVQNRIWDEVRTRVETGLAQGKYQNGIVVADSSWHEGVVGIVASRVTETFRKPAAVIALREDFGKGSVRTFAGKDVLAALRASASTLLGFGGHRHAAGLSLAHDQLEPFTKAFDDALALLQEDASARPLWLDGDCSIADLTLKTLQELENLGPFGPGNPEPLFRIRATVQGLRVLKERHLKLSLLSLSSLSEPPLEGIWFHAAEHKDDLEKTFESDSEWVGVPEINRFRGKMTPTFRIRDWRGPSA